MRRVLLHASLVVLALPALPLQSFAQAGETGSGRRLVTVTRTVRQSVMPDRATLVLTAEALLADPADAAARLATIDRAIADTLRRLGIQSSQIQIVPQGVSIAHQPGGYPQGIPQYAARSVIRVTLDRVDQVATVSNASLGKGGVHVNAPAFEYAAEDSLRRVLVQRGIAEARRDAENLARSMGGRLGPMLEVTQNSATQGFTQPEMVVFPSTMQFGGFTGRQPTSATVAASVTVRWAFLEGG